MAFEMDLKGVSVDIEYDWDFNRGRTLLRTPQFDDPGFVRLRVEGGRRDAPKSGSYVVVEFFDSAGNNTVAQYEQIRDIPDFGRFVDRLTRRPFERESETIDVPLESDEILGQYERGTYRNLSPGSVDVEVRIEDRFGNGNVLVGPVTGGFNLGVPSDAHVRENTEIRSLSLRVDGTTVTPSVEFAVLADHGVALPVDVEARVGDEVVASDSLVVEDLSGSRDNTPEVTPADLPSFELDGMPYQDNRLTYRLMPREWAEGWVNVAETARDIAGISVNDVEITGCRTRPQQLRAGGNLTVNSSVRNPLPTAVGVEGQFVFGGATSPFSKEVPAGGLTQFSASFTATTVGTATPTIELSTVDGIDVSTQSSCGEVTVDPAFSADRISVGSCSVDTPNDVRPGDGVEATATVTNSSDNAPTTATVAFTSAGDTVTQSVGLAPGESKTVSASFSYPEAGDYPIDVGLKNATAR